MQPDQFRAGGQVVADVVTGASRMGAVGEKVIDRHDAVHVARESPERMDERVGDSVLVQIPAFEAHPELERGIALLEEIALVDADFPQHCDHARERALADPDDRHRRRFDQHDLDAASALGGIELGIEEGRGEPSGRAAADDRDLLDQPGIHNALRRLIEPPRRPGVRACEVPFCHAALLASEALYSGKPSVASILWRFPIGRNLYRALHIDFI